MKTPRAANRTGKSGRVRGVSMGPTRRSGWAASSTSSSCCRNPNPNPSPDPGLALTLTLALTLA